LQDPSRLGRSLRQYGANVPGRSGKVGSELILIDYSVALSLDQASLLRF
jgi:hypothetical protein